MTVSLLDFPAKVWTMANEIILESELTCPHCGHRKIETMPTDACQFFYDCAGCGALLRPKPGDCCVFCSYGSVVCPPKQVDTDCCRS
jgi:hypothetical protein